MMENTVKNNDQGVKSSDQSVKLAVKAADQSCINLENGHDFYTKAARNLENNRYGKVKIWITVTMTMVCLGMTLYDVAAKQQFCAYMITCACVLLLDTAQAFTRLLAKQSRWIIASVLIMIVVGVITQHKNYCIVVTMLSFLLLAFVFLMNTRWLAADNWLMSAAAQAALDVDLDNTATRAWQSHGRRETRTLLYELGCPADDKSLDIMHKPVYLAGYLNGYQKTAKQKSRLQAAQEAVKEANQEINRLHIQLDQAKQSERTALQEHADMKSKLDESKYYEEYWQKKYNQEHRLVADLMEANELLVAELPEPMAAIVAQDNLARIQEQSRDQKIQAALNAGMSFREAAKFAGCSHGTVNNYVKRSKEESSGKIVAFRTE